MSEVESGLTNPKFSPADMPARKKPLVVSHRGASGYAPEATLAAYRLAREMGADSWELDVRMSLDRQIVALHDSSVNRTTDGKGEVERLTLAELKKLDAGSWFNRSFPAKARPDFVGERKRRLTENQPRRNAQEQSEFPNSCRHLR